MQKCEKCDNPIMPTSKRFCSRSCANKRTHPQETKDKISKSLATNIPVTKGKMLVERVKSKCVVCYKDILLLPSDKNKKNCSKECLSIHMKKACGGYREGSGRSNPGYYQGIYCGSTYELVWVMYNLNHNISFSKCNEYFLYDGSRKYYPDFVLGDTIIEIKGFITDVVLRKAEAVKNSGKKINILTKQDLKYAFGWFRDTFPGKRLQEMYDNYKPKYEYKCSHCETMYVTNVRKKTEKNYCSKSCSMKGNNIFNMVDPTGYAQVSSG